MITGQQVVEAARQYVGVPIVEFGRSREGCDCVGLVLGVARDLALDFPANFQSYGLNIWLHPKASEARDLLSQYMEIVRLPQVGDVILFGLSVIAVSVGIVTAVDKEGIQKMIGGLHELGPYFAEYDFIPERCKVAGCYRFREVGESAFEMSLDATADLTPAEPASNSTGAE
jgi:hypothetical protein